MKINNKRTINQNIKVIIENLRKDLIRKNKSYFFTLNEITDIILLNSNFDLEIDSIKCKISKNLSKYEVKLKRNKQSYNFYPIESVIQYFEDLDYEGDIIIKNDIESLINDYIPLDYLEEII